MKKLCGAAMALAMMTSSVLAGNVAATISDFNGKVLINKGKGFVPATGSVALNDGDKVLVGDNSFAVVSYAECAVSISAPTVMAISTAAPCAGASGDVAIVQPVADPVAAEVSPVFPLPLLFLGAAGVVGGVLLFTDVLDDNDDPAPPVSAP
jgi:hypothetical protein